MVKNIKQQTLQDTVSTKGVALHSGDMVSLILKPAPVNTGIVFVRSDLENVSYKARWQQVAPSSLCTTLGQGAERIATIEHLMAAFAGAGVDNAIVEVSGCEIPVLDGSAAPFLFLIDSVGLKEQAADRLFLQIKKTIAVQEGDAAASIAPAPFASIAFHIDFPDAAIGQQNCSMRVKPETFRQLIAGARTFVQAKDVEYLQANGLAKGGSLENAVVVENGKVLNPYGLRFADECVRHKMLDAIGDLYLAGMPVIGHFKGHKSGHALTRKLLEAVFADRKNYQYISLPQVEQKVSQPGYHSPDLMISSLTVS